MNDPLGYLDLADWRRQVARMYTDVRAAPRAGRRIAWNEWRAARNDLFRQHGQSPLPARQRALFQGLDYFAYDPAWRVAADFHPDHPDHGRTYHYQLGQDGDFSMTRIGWAAFAVGGNEGRLALYWIAGYGGGLFLPFQDATNQKPGSGQGDTYGGGRYLVDTIKGADLGLKNEKLTLDFNYAYNPSCAYDARWVCPLAPAENRLPFPITAGEKRYIPR